MNRASGVLGWATAGRLGRVVPRRAGGRRVVAGAGRGRVACEVLPAVVLPCGAAPLGWRGRGRGVAVVACLLRVPVPVGPPVVDRTGDVPVLGVPFPAFPPAMAPVLGVPAPAFPPAVAPVLAVPAPAFPPEDAPGGFTPVAGRALVPSAVLRRAGSGRDGRASGMRRLLGPRR
ncbi:MAG TPA: hypothetical protein VET24_07355 [Actinomycetota bacterium]|nr:hypothetical protein [Actinomycetota bacterium]